MRSRSSARTWITKHRCAASAGRARSTIRSRIASGSGESAMARATSASAPATAAPTTSRSPPIAHLDAGIRASCSRRPSVAPRFAARQGHTCRLRTRCGWSYLGWNSLPRLRLEDAGHGDPGLERDGVEGPGNVGEEAELESGLGTRAIPALAGRDDRNLLVVAPEFAHDLERIEAVHLGLDDDEIRPPRRERFHGLGSARGGEHLVLVPVLEPFE